MKHLTSKQFFLLTVALLYAFSSFASHMIGGGFTYKLIDSTSATYHYRVTLTIFEDCEHGMPEAIAQDNPAFFSVYSGAGARIAADTAIYYDSSVSITPMSVCDACARGIAGGCILKKVFNKDYYLPASSSGYTVVYQRCCLVNAVTSVPSPEDKGITYYCTIPPSGTTPHNNSAMFSHLPQRQICLGHSFTFDHSATDADGDSLSYEICTAYKGASDADIKPIPLPPPFDPMDYITPLTYSNPVSCSVPLAIDPVTGIMSCTPNAIGKYMVTICCNEWRSGVLINSDSRMFVLVVGTVDSMAYHPFAGNDTTILAGDSIRFEASGATSYLWSPATYLSSDTVADPLGIFPDAGSFQYILTGSGSACSGSDTITVTVFGYSPVHMPTGFTPNQDGTNDILRPIPTMDSKVKSFSVYNRSGKLLFNCNTANCGWDGRYNGVLQGIDTYIWQVEYEDSKGKNRTARGTTTLLR